MSHTPGPWSYDGDYIWADAIKGYVADPKTDDMTNGSAIPTRECHAVIDANARLIAAAPELLEALKAICEELADDCDYDAKAIARYAGAAAIAKAEGK